MKGQKMSKEDEALNKIDEIDDKYQEKVKELQAELKKAFDIDQYNIDHEIISTISNIHFWNTRLAEEKMVLNKMNRMKKKIHGELYEKMKFNHHQKLDNRSEIEEWICRSPKYQRIETYYENQKTLVEYIDRLVTTLRDKRWSIRDIIENKKVELG